MGRLLTASGQEGRSVKGWPRGRARVCSRNRFPRFARAQRALFLAVVLLSPACTLEAPGGLGKDQAPPPDNSELLNLGGAQALVAWFYKIPL